MGSSATQSSRASRRDIRQQASTREVSLHPADRLGVIERIAGPHVRDAVARVLADRPTDISHISEDELIRHLEWIARAGRAGGDALPDENGATVVLRRRLLDLVRAQLLHVWTEQPPAAAVMLDALNALERARAASAATAEQSFAAELADKGGADLVVEVAHDMRSPLTSILFLSEILHKGQSGPLNDVQRRQIGIVYSAALGLVGMASDMIEVARGGSRLASKNPVPFSVNEILHSVNDLVRPTAEEKGLDLKIEGLHSEHRVGYPIPLSRVLLNLTTNAMKFTHDGTITLTAHPVGGTRVEFAVRDTGPGIPEDAVESLYHPFRREPGRKTGYYFSGTGLGLAICRRLCSAMGTELRLETRKDWGTRFSFEIELPPANLL
jgi:signal transduction histidine kinase